MTARDDATEAGAKAMFESGMPKAITPWERRSDDYKRPFLDEAALIHDAMAPLIRQAVAEEIATAIEDQGMDHFDTHPDQDRLDDCQRYAGIAREIGGAS